jgi:hypothetical protein
MARKKTVNPDRYIANEPHERALYRWNVLPHFWHPTLSNVAFRTTSYRGKPFSATAQRQWIRAVASGAYRRLPTVVISSTPTDNGAFYLGCYLLTQFVKARKKAVYVHNAANPVKSLVTYPHMIMTHNLLERSPMDHLQYLRNFLTSRFPFAGHVLVVGGTKDPEKWMFTKLGMYPDAVMLVADKTPEQLKADQ